ncbi:MAG: carbohydrate ABC transporter permease [Limnochordales bacterium]|nr:ABC transporter permease [Bacillota bacterium]REJ34611.1 MAG: ABC transporter permease [Bacillota bacterium]
MRSRTPTPSQLLQRLGLNKLLIHLILMMVAGVTAMPYLFALSTSLKHRTEVFTPVPQWIPSSLRFANYADAMAIAPFGTYFINTVIVVLGILAVQLVTATLAGYVFARLRFRGSSLLFGLFLIQMMLPVHAVIVPNYLTIKELGLLDTRVAMMMPFWASGYATFLLRQAFRQIPQDFEDAALIDGCSGPRFLWSVLIPLAKPTIIAFSLISIVTHWNDFLWPLIVTDSPQVRTLTIGLAMFVQQESGADWPLLMAGTILVTAPLMVLFLIYQRKFVESFMHAGVKG